MTGAPPGISSLTSSQSILFLLPCFCLILTKCYVESLHLSRLIEKSLSLFSLVQMCVIACKASSALKRVQYILYMLHLWWGALALQRNGPKRGMTLQPILYLHTPYLVGIHLD